MCPHSMFFEGHSFLWLGFGYLQFIIVVGIHSFKFNMETHAMPGSIRLIVPDQRAQDGSRKTAPTGERKQAVKN
jgi:hypothetical protein